MRRRAKPTEAWRTDEQGELDDVVVPDVETFRLERLGVGQWWIGLYRTDGSCVHIDIAGDRRAVVRAFKRED